MPSITRLRALGATGAVALAAPFLTAIAGAAPRADGADLKLLNSVIPLERAAVKAYAEATALGILGPGVLAVLKRFMADHQAHLDALVAAVTQAGGVLSPDTAPLEVPTLKTERDVLDFTYTVERLVASTHLGTIAQYKNRDFATTAAAIMGVDTTHVALLAEALRKTPAYPTSFVTG
ncbi:MAG: hypothetical protein NVS2B8_07440 [Vulcanimicrobiaceae bacterium]